jgi:periplasmic protein TonB
MPFPAFPRELIDPGKRPGRSPEGQGGYRVQSSTVVRRTGAGNAELAAPAHGLSLTQRRFLTLLDTSCTVDELAVRHPAEVRKFERDLTRLAELGLVACDVPIPANEPNAAPVAVSVRLGGPGLVRRLPLILLPLAAALAWAAWHQWAAPADRSSEHDAGANAVSATAQAHPDPQSADPEPIATRVLKSDPAERTRDAARGQPKGADRRPENPPTNPLDLPVEHRSPPHEDAAYASAPLVASPVLPLQLAPLPVAPSANPMPLPALIPMPAVPGPAANPGAAAPASQIVTTPAIQLATAAPIQVAKAAPTDGLLRPAPLPGLVPISRESPSFPREAIALGLADGNVKARLTIDARGNVGNVEIVDASHRAFTRAVREALVRWRFEPGTAGRTTTVDVAFKRD